MKFDTSFVVLVLFVIVFVVLVFLKLFVFNGEEHYFEEENYPLKSYSCKQIRVALLGDQLLPKSNVFNFLGTPYHSVESMEWHYKYGCIYKEFDNLGLGSESKPRLWLD